MKKVVVLEDDPQMRKNLVRILQLESYEPVEAEDGEMGLRLVKEHCPDLILCDVALPLIDGFKVLEKVRSSQKNALTPFIFLTSKGEKSDVRKGLALGANDYLTKPFTPEDLLKAIQSQLDNPSKDKKSEPFSVAHELRTPLSILLLSLDSLRLHLSQKEKDEVLSEMRAQIIKMNRILDHLSPSIKWK